MVPKERPSPCLQSDTPPVKDEISPRLLISESRGPRNSGKEGLQPAGSEKQHCDTTVTGLPDSLLIAM